MSDYIQLWLQVIENMHNENTYKLAWGRAILEIIIERQDIHDLKTIHFEEIAKKMLKYYWNQIYFFQLKQGPNKKPIIVQETEDCIAYVNSIRQSSIPIWFDKAETILLNDQSYYQNKIKKIAATLVKDVSWRFPIVQGQTLEIYQLDKSKKTIQLTEHNILELKKYAFILSQLFNYRWAQLLEKFNNCPKISLKVKGISDEKIRRHNLSKFKDILLSQMKDEKIIDFYTGDILKDNDISVDHVIPWSFMYSDDIWNLVITSKSQNSKKNNHIPSKDIIEKLENRNKKLLLTIKEEKYYQELKNAVDHDYVRKFYLSCKL